MISKKRLLTIVSLLIVVAFLNTGMFAAFSDVENNANNQISAYTPKMWKSTTEDDFYNNTTVTNVLVKDVPGSVLLAESDTADSSLYALAGGGTNKFYRYYTASNTWLTRTPTPANVGYGGSMAMDDSRYIYAMRGAGTTDFWRFDTTANSWESRAPTPGNVGAGGFLRYYNGMFYALQGGNTANLWKYDPVANTWATLSTTVPVIGVTNAHGASMIVYKDFIYILRSQSVANDPNTFIRLNLDGTGMVALSNGKPYNSDIRAGTSITHGQGSYLIATRGDGIRDFLEYNMATNKWAKLGNLPKKPPIAVGSDLAYDNIRPYVTVGGGSNVMFKYNSTLRAWSQTATAPGPLGYGGNLLYVAFASGRHPTGALNSSVFDTGVLNGKYDSLFADYDQPSGTGILFKVRASNIRHWIAENASDPTNPNGTWDLSGAWTTVTGSSISTITGQYVQWRVEMTTSSPYATTPRLDEVRLYYRGF